MLIAGSLQAFYDGIGEERLDPLEKRTAAHL